MDARILPRVLKAMMSIWTSLLWLMTACLQDVSPVGSDEEQQHVSVQVEHVDDQETEIVDNNVHDIVQHSPPVL